MSKSKIEQIKGLQEKLQFMNRNGSFMKIDLGEGLEIMPMVDSYIVTDITDGMVEILWKEVGYDFGQQYTHVAQFEKFIPDEVVEDKHAGSQWVVFDAVDDMGRRYHAEMILKIMEPEAFESWKKWQKYRTNNKAMFDSVDAGMVSGFPNLVEIAGGKK